MKVWKCLWIYEPTSELLVKQYGPNLRIVSVFSEEELRKKSDPEFFSKCIPLSGTMVWVNEEIAEDSPSNPVIEVKNEAET